MKTNASALDSFFLSIRARERPQRRQLSFLHKLHNKWSEVDFVKKGMVTMNKYKIFMHQKILNWIFFATPSSLSRSLFVACFNTIFIKESVITGELELKMRLYYATIRL